MYKMLMALNGLFCAEVPWGNYLLTHLIPLSAMWTVTSSLVGRQR